jgi:ribosomal protein S18 acetylase RimI-like enzyme
MQLRRYDEVNPSSEQRQAFDCGHESLNRWLARQARQSMDSRDAVTYLLVDPAAARIAGYFCLAAGSVSRQHAASDVAKRAPEPIPVVRMGRFAIDLDYQGQGWGADLLAEAIRSAMAAQQAIGARALLVDAIDERAKSFYTRYGFVESPIITLQLMLPLHVARLPAAVAATRRIDRA